MEMGSNHHRVFMCTPNLTVSNKKESRQRRPYFCDARHKLEVDIYFLARSGVDIIETGWNLNLEKRMLIQSLKMLVV
jgi:hypothetical protein